MFNPQRISGSSTGEIWSETLDSTDFFSDISSDATDFDFLPVLFLDRLFVVTWDDLPVKSAGDAIGELVLVIFSTFSVRSSFSLSPANRAFKQVFLLEQLFNEKSETNYLILGRLGKIFHGSYYGIINSQTVCKE